MKLLWISTIGTLILSCSESKKEIQHSDANSSTILQEPEGFDWLLGEWKRLNEEEGKETFENWWKIGETEYSGIGFTMQNGDTIKQEKIQLIQNEGKWSLTVKVPEELESVTFDGINHAENEFTCGNTEIDFPNKIRYWKNGDKINASVSGGEMEISFEFEKFKN